MNNLLVEVKNLSVGYTSRSGVTLPILRNIDLSFGKGETIGLVGESGCGKSTLGDTRAVTQCARCSAGRRGHALVMDAAGVQLAVVSRVWCHTAHAGLGPDDFRRAKLHVARAVGSAGTCHRAQFVDCRDQLECRRAGQGFGYRSSPKGSPLVLRFQHMIPAVRHEARRLPRFHGNEVSRAEH